MQGPSGNDVSFLFAIERAHVISAFILLSPTVCKSFFPATFSVLNYCIYSAGKRKSNNNLLFFEASFFYLCRISPFEDICADNKKGWQNGWNGFFILLGLAWPAHPDMPPSTVITWPDEKGCAIII